jgi:hypothetical protein
MNKQTKLRTKTAKAKAPNVMNSEFEKMIAAIAYGMGFEEFYSQNPFHMRFEVLNNLFFNLTDGVLPRAFGSLVWFKPTLVTEAASVQDYALNKLTMDHFDDPKFKEMANTQIAFGADLVTSENLYQRVESQFVNWLSEKTEPGLAARLHAVKRMDGGGNFLEFGDEAIYQDFYKSKNELEFIIQPLIDKVKRSAMYPNEKFNTLLDLRAREYAIKAKLALYKAHPKKGYNWMAFNLDDKDFIENYKAVKLAEMEQRCNNVNWHPWPAKYILDLYYGQAQTPDLNPTTGEVIMDYYMGLTDDEAHWFFLTGLLWSRGNFLTQEEARIVNDYNYFVELSQDSDRIVDRSDSVHAWIDLKHDIQEEGSARQELWEIVCKYHNIPTTLTQLHELRFIAFNEHHGLPNFKKETESATASAGYFADACYVPNSNNQSHTKEITDPNNPNAKKLEIVYRKRIFPNYNYTKDVEIFNPYQGEVCNAQLLDSFLSIKRTNLSTNYSTRDSCKLQVPYKGILIFGELNESMTAFESLDSALMKVHPRTGSSSFVYRECVHQDFRDHKNICCADDIYFFKMTV